MKTNNQILNANTPAGMAWCYKSKQKAENEFEMQAFLPNAKEGDTIIVHPNFVPNDEGVNTCNYFQITKILLQRNHAGNFKNKELAKNSYVIFTSRQLSFQERDTLLTSRNA